MSSLYDHTAKDHAVFDKSCGQKSESLRIEAEASAGNSGECEKRSSETDQAVNDISLLLACVRSLIDGEAIDSISGSSTTTRVAYAHTVGDKDGGNASVIVAIDAADSA